MTDRLERDLTALLNDRASDTDASPPPLDRMVRDGKAAAARRRRTRLVTAGAVAAVVVLAVAVPLGLGSLTDDSTPAPADIPEVVNTSTERPESLADLPLGAELVTPYLIDGVLWRDGDPLELPGDGGAVASSDTTISWRPLPSNDPDVFPVRVRVHDGETWTDIAEGELDGVLLDPDGSTVVLALRTEPEVWDTELTAIDTATGNVLGNTDLPGIHPAGFRLLGLDGDGRVFIDNGRGQGMVWKPGEPQRRVTLPDGSTARLSAATPYAITLRSGAYGEVDAEGRFDQRGKLPPIGDLVTPRWSRDGTVMAYVEGSGPVEGPASVTAVDLTTGETTELRIPPKVFVEVATLEGNQNVLVEVSEEMDPGPAVLRCSIDTGACDRVDMPDTDDYVHLLE